MFEAAENKLTLERELALDLDQARRSVCSEERSINAGGRVHGQHDRAELSGSDVSSWLIEVRVVEDVEEVGSDRELGAFPLGNFEGLAQLKIGVKEAWPVELVAALIAETSQRWSEVCGV
jgi:hypothetical protein